ncbi:serine/threonine-protein kinase [Nonomuraea zeae]|uniref:non-specific serine/threonine protein kinase n=1 Tax=Nonomuraea zeae TaxID=1642303 RepID=A0A5S4FI22_9ACTN|nr:serine/threonine-protein kinase [Nonomuraea zeae]TMR20025.1 serine/threonine protein kinase [Nonomuraea zeae]
MERQVSNRYRLIEPLGEGGMGVVWRAYDELLDRTVAIKEVRYSGVGDAKRAELNSRTIREARAAGRLDHPSVIVIHDVVEEDGRPWIVMQLVRSRSLAQVLQEQGPLQAGQAAVIGGRVLDALRAAHATGVLHRDVKPENVLLADDGRVVLTDFGIASLEAEAGLTATGGLVGTPAYMPPERLNGEPARPESDLWSLGATIYAAVEGEPPFRRDSWAATVAAVLRDEPRPPARAGALEPVIMGLLRRDPATRMPAEQAARMLYEVASAPRWPSPPGHPQPPGAAPAIGAAQAAGAAPAGGRHGDPAGYPSGHPSKAPGGYSGGHPSGDRAGYSGGDPSGAPGGYSGGHSGGDPGDQRGAGRWQSGDGRPHLATGGGSEAVTGSSVTGRPHQTLPVRRRVGGKALWIGVPAAVAAVAVLGTAGVLLSSQGTSTTTPSPTPTTGPATTSPPTTGPTPKPSPTRTNRPLPAGWRSYSNAAGRFSIALPRQWQAVQDPVRDSISIAGPGTSGKMIVEWTVPDIPWDDPKAHWLGLEKEIRAKGEFQQYTRLGITSTAYLGLKAADWEFTRMRGGQLIHVINRGFHTADGRPYALYWEAPDARWDRDRHYFDTFVKTFRPR